MLLRAREADRALRKQRAASLEERACRLRKLRNWTGQASFKAAVLSVVVLLAPLPQPFLFLVLLGLGVSAGFLALYLLLHRYLRKLERERDFYGWIPDTRVLPPDWKQM
jgi:hypothetical protein